MHRYIRNKQYPNQSQHHQPQPQQPLLVPFRVGDYFQHDNANLLNRNSSAFQNSSEIRNFDYVRGPDGQDGGPRGSYGCDGCAAFSNSNSRGNSGNRNYRGNFQRPVVNPNYVLRPMPNQTMFQQPPSRNGTNFQSKNCNSNFGNGGLNPQMNAHDRVRAIEDPALLLASQVENQTKQHSIRLNPNPSNQSLMLSNPISFFQRDTDNYGELDEEALARPDLATFATPPFTANTGHYHGDRYYEPIKQQSDQNSSTSSCFGNSGASNFGNGLINGNYSGNSGFSGNLASTSGGALFPRQPSTGGTNYLAGIFPFGGQPQAQATGATRPIFACTGCGMHFQSDI